MVDVPEDVWVLIFRSYLEEPSTMPIDLIPVCRLWRNIISAIPGLWTQIVIPINRSGKVACILSSTGFQQYLSLTDYRQPMPMDDSNDAVFPLHIEIRCKAPTAEEHATICGDGSRSDQCKCVKERGHQIARLLLFLATGDTGSSLPTPELQASTEVQAISKENLGRINRWSSLSIVFDGPLVPGLLFYESIDNRILLQDASYSAPRLSHLSLQNCSLDYEPHPHFAPNLTKLTVSNSVFCRHMIIPNLKTLSLAWDAKQDPPYGRHVPYSAAEVILDYPYDRDPGPGIQFNVIRILRIHNTIPRCFLKRSEKCTDSQRLEVVYLRNITATSISILSKIPIILNAKKIVFQHIRSLRPSSRYRNYDPSSAELLFREFLRVCSPDTEIISENDGFFRALVDIRKEAQLVLA